MTSRLQMRRPLAVAASLLFTGLSTGLAAEPAAAANQRVLFDGFGTYPVTEQGSVAVTATVAGEPFDGTYTGELAAVDGSLPAPGDCEPATATVRLDGARDRFAVLHTDDGIGRVCGQWTDSTNRVTVVFTGRYRITDSDRRRLIGSDGWYEIRLTDTGAASVFAVDT